MRVDSKDDAMRLTDYAGLVGDGGLAQGYKITERPWYYEDDLEDDFEENEQFLLLSSYLQFFNRNMEKHGEYDGSNAFRLTGRVIKEQPGAERKVGKKVVIWRFQRNMKDNGSA